MGKAKPAKTRARAAPQPVSVRRWPRPALAPAILSFAVYANSLGNGFVGDDKEQLLQNPVVSAHNIAAAIGSGVWAFRGSAGNYYRPLQFLVYILLHGLFGFHAFAFHLLFVLLHAANSVLVYALAWRLTGRDRAALAASLLFAVHPIHTEVVDWIASLPDLMLTSIVLLAVWWFARKEGRPRGLEIAGHCGFYLAALLSKETGVVLLLLYAGCERFALRRTLSQMKSNLKFYGALLATLAVYLAARGSALGGLAPGQETFHHLAPAEFGLTAVVIAAQYAGRLLYTGDLNYFHVFHPTTGIDSGFLIALAALIGLAALGVRRRTPSWMSFGLVWIALTLAPALNLTGVGQNMFAERYLYLPSVGFVWIAGMAWTWLADRRAPLAWAAGMAILCACSWQTIARNGDWHDDYTLLRKTVTQSPDSGIMHNNLAGVYVDRNEFERALAEERLAVKCEPLAEPFHKNLGAMLLALHHPREAVGEFEIAVRLQPSDGMARDLLREAQAAAAGQ